MIIPAKFGHDSIVGWWLMEEMSIEANVGDRGTHGRHQTITISHLEPMAQLRHYLL